MKKIENIKKPNFLKKLFIKLCRIIGFEIIDQSNFRSSTLNKDLNETLSADLLLSLDTALNNVAEKYSPNDPMLLRLPLELAIGFLGPKGIKYTYKGAKYGTKVAVVGRPGAKLISNIEKANLSNKPYATPTPIQIQASKEVQIKANSPIATTLVVNPKKASKLIAASLEDKTNMDI